MKAPSPAPVKQRWNLAIEFLDGTTITGVDAADILDRWGRLLGWSVGRPLDPDEVKDHAVRFAIGFYGCPLERTAATLDDLAFLEALAAAKAIFLIER